MKFSLRFAIVIVSLVTALVLISALIANYSKPKDVRVIQGYVPRLRMAATPTPFEPFPYDPPEIPKMRSYRIMLVGDSMVGSLGPNAERLRQHLIARYPDSEFVSYNYGFGATSIETLPKRLVEETEYGGEKFPSILSQGFDLVVIGSFAYNPLSQDAPGEGVERHISILDESIKIIIKEKPESVVAIMTPIAPSKSYFATGVYDLTPSERRQWAEERISYIEAVTNYAKENNVSLINVYEKSLNTRGEGDLIYINPDDFIHPSAEGVELISRTIAEHILENSIFPR